MTPTERRLPPGFQQKEALVLQAASYQAVLHGLPGGYCSHVLADGEYTIWHSHPRQGTFPPPKDLRQARTQAYYKTVETRPLAFLMHTIIAPSRRQGPVWANSSTWIPTRMSTCEPLGRATPFTPQMSRNSTQDPSRMPAQQPISRSRKRGGRSAMWVVCMFSPADAHIVAWDPQHLPRPEATIRMADCAGVVVKALKEDNHYVLLLHVRLRHDPKAAKPGVWPDAHCSLSTLICSRRS